MPHDAGFPYFELPFTKRGRLARPAATRRLLEHLQDGQPTDLFVLSHGWNNDMAEARTLYAELLENLRDRLDAAPEARDRRFAAVGVLWPSKKFAERDLIPGGAAAFGGGHDVPDAALEERLDELHGAFDARGANARLRRARALVSDLDDPEAQDAFADAVRALLPKEEAEDDEIPPELFDEEGRRVLDTLSRPEPPPRPTLDAGMGGAAGGVGGAAGDIGGPYGGAAGLGDVFKGVRAGALRLVNYVTYYQMKARAGEVAREGLAPLLGAVLDAHPALRLHLVGHSFGGRLVTATASALRDGHRAASLTLLQAAFSHFGLTERYEGEKNGAFCNVVRDGKVAGPIVITHTANDKAVGYAYPLASRFALQVGAGLGDEHDRYGGIGRNGALKANGTAERLHHAAHAYAFAPATLYNLLADDYIADHGDVAGPEVANAVVHAALAG